MTNLRLIVLGVVVIIGGIVAFSSLYKNEKTSTLGDEIAIPLNDFHGFQVSAHCCSHR